MGVNGDTYFAWTQFTRCYFWRRHGKHAVVCLRDAVHTVPFGLRAGGAARSGRGHAHNGGCVSAAARHRVRGLPEDLHRLHDLQRRVADDVSP